MDDPHRRRGDLVAGIAEVRVRMPSLKSHVVSFVLRHSRKKAFSSPENLQRWIACARKTQDLRPPASLRSRLDIRTCSVDGFPVYAIAPRAGERKRILYLHGGAY